MIDEDKKKKKKKPKKKKKKTTAEESEEIKQSLEEADTITPMTSPVPAVTTPTSSTFSPTVTSPKPSRVSTDVGGSTISLPIAPASAQSAHSYIANEQKSTKTKVKTRADPAQLEEEAARARKKGFFPKFGGGKSKAEQKEQASKQDAQDAEADGSNIFGKIGVFNLPKKASALVGQLLGSKDDETKGQSSMRWDHFVKVQHTSTNKLRADSA